MTSETQATVNEAVKTSEQQNKVNGLNELQRRDGSSTSRSIEVDMVDLTMEIMSFAIARISSRTPYLGAPKTEESLRDLVGDTVTPNGLGGKQAFSLFKEHLLPATVATNHPRFLSFIPAAPSRSSVLFDLVTSATSIHGATWMTGAGGVFCENEAMRWIVGLTGLPDTAFGVFTSGGTVANLSAMIVARENWREQKPECARIRPIIILADSAHSSNKHMAKVIDADFVEAELDAQERLTGAAIQKVFETLTATEKQRVSCVIATAGTTNAGVIDDLVSIGRWCEQHDIWFHVDAAYGGGALASAKIRPLFQGIELANSITIDPHKWMFTTYDCGVIIYRDIKQAKKAHTQTAPYLDIFEDEAAKGFNPADYQIQLSRRLRGLQMWFSLAMNGTQIYSDSIDYAIDLTKYAEQQINELEHLEMVRPRGLSIVILRRKGWQERDYYVWSIELQKQGMAMVMPTKWNGETVTRMCFINDNTTKEDIDNILSSML